MKKQKEERVESGAIFLAQAFNRFLDTNFVVKNLDGSNLELQKENSSLLVEMIFPQKRHALAKCECLLL